jgi:ABC-type multidrug transport system ATPase subunit
MSLNITSIDKSYGRAIGQGDKIQVLHNLCLTLPDGGVVALLGENGTGKTTLLKCILGLVLPTRGEITWNNEKIQKLIAKGGVGYLPENLLFPAMVSLEEYVKDLATLRGIKNLQDTLYPKLLADLFPTGQEKRPLPHLSKGNKKKAGFIQAIFHQPSLVVLDEPTDGLDPVSRETMLEYIRNLGKAGSLVLMSSHQMGDVSQSADQVLVLSNGHVAAIAVLSELQENLEDWYREVIRFQKGEQ